MTKRSKVSEAARALSMASRAKRLATLTPEQRSAQARKAVNSRRDRQKPGPWCGLVDVPPLPWEIYDKQDKGFAAWVEQVDKALATTAGVIWFRSQAELDQEVQRRTQLQDGLVLQFAGVNFNPAKYGVNRAYKPDTTKLLDGMHALLGDEERSL